MEFQKNTVFHIYNQGNNRQKVFFTPENYIFFIQKMRTHVAPFGDFLCYCLMPNHFHWLFYVREVELALPNVGVTRNSVGVTLSHSDTTSGRADIKPRTLNDSIGILLRSYTRAINKQENRTGALFREKTKAKDGWGNQYPTKTPAKYDIPVLRWEDYGWTAFNYIHQNPVKAGLVSHPEEWSYSSALDFAGSRKGTLCNQDLAKELLFLQ
jgi:putative transposase